ncbi:MAG: hypothetical protein C4539_00745 [Ignavibacteriales bacterium]|nr:MAG: hypothetical protein C4539_00745 [Ignavibacteriales bacterium]
MPQIKDTITENDLFNYVFFPDSLNEEKKKTILREDRFKNSTDFYKGMYKDLGKSISIEARKKIAHLIPSYRMTEKVDLYPVAFTKTAISKKIYASDENIKQKYVSMSLTDEEKSYLARIICQDEHCQLFIFSSNNLIIRDFDVTLFPQGKKYHFDDNTKPIEVMVKPNIKKLVMTLK